MMKSFVWTGKDMLKKLFVAMLAMTLATMGVAGAHAEKSWFSYTETAAKDWKVISDPNNHRIVRLVPRKSNPGSMQKIFVLYTKKSSAYEIAISKMLNVFEQRNINAEFAVYNFEQKDDLGRGALKMAEKSGAKLIFSMGSAATDWLWKHYRGGKIPVVSVCSKDPVVLGQVDSYEKGTGTNFAFTSLNMPLDVQMAYVLDLKPNLKNLGVLVDAQNVSAVRTQAKPIADFARKRGIQIFNLSVRQSSKAAEELATLVPNAVAKMRKNDPRLDNSLFWITGSTSIFREIKVINSYSDRVPVLSVVPEVVRAGDDSAVLSIGVSFESNAHLAAIYGAEVLDNPAKVGEMKVGIVSPPDIAINFRKAREIGLEVPFNFFESASFVYDYEGRLVRDNGKPVVPTSSTNC